MHQQEVCPQANKRQTLCRLWDGFIVHKAYSSGRFFLIIINGIIFKNLEEFISYSISKDFMNNINAENLYDINYIVYKSYHKG